MEASLMNTHTTHIASRLIGTVTKEVAQSTITVHSDRKMRRSGRLCGGKAIRPSSVRIADDASDAGCGTGSE